MKNHLYSLYQMILQSLTFYLGVNQEKKKAGRPPKVSDLQLCTPSLRVYRLLKEYRNRRILSILFAKKVKLIVGGTILEVANLNRTRTQRIKRFSGKAF